MAAVGRRPGRRVVATRGAGVGPAQRRGPHRRSPGGGPAAPLPLTDADEGSALGVEAVLPSSDGRTLWLLANDLGPTGRDFVAAQLGLYRLPIDAPGAVPERLTDPEHDQLAAVVAELDGDPLVIVEHRGAAHLVRVAPDGTSTTLVGGTHVVSGAAVAAGRVVVTAATPSSSGEVFLVDPATGTLEARTDLGAELRATGRTRVPAELVATSPDGYEVHGWVVTPDEARHGAGPHPTILMIHGGPFAQYTHALFDEVQVLVEAGYAVVLGNPRGSSGYGRAHGLAIHRGFGTVDTDDVLALLDAALENPALDGERVGVMGGSYGGYLTAWLTTRTDRFVAAIVERGFLDPVSFVGSSDIGWFFGLEYLGDADDDQPGGSAAAVAAQSPMAHVGRVRTPTLVIHSEQDWRCPVEQGQRWFVELKRRGVPAELLLFPGEGHGSPGRATRSTGWPASSTCCGGGRHTCPSGPRSPFARARTPRLIPTSTACGSIAASSSSVTGGRATAARFSSSWAVVRAPTSTVVTRGSRSTQASASWGSVRPRPGPRVERPHVVQRLR